MDYFPGNCKTKISNKLDATLTHTIQNFVSIRDASLSHCHTKDKMIKSELRKDKTIMSILNKILNHKLLSVFTLSEKLYVVHGHLFCVCGKLSPSRERARAERSPFAACDTAMALPQVGKPSQTIFSAAAERTTTRWKARQPASSEGFFL